MLVCLEGGRARQERRPEPGTTYPVAAVGHSTRSGDRPSGEPREGGARGCEFVYATLQHVSANLRHEIEWEIAHQFSRVKVGCELHETEDAWLRVVPEAALTKGFEADGLGRRRVHWRKRFEVRRYSGSGLNRGPDLDQEKHVAVDPVELDNVAVRAHDPNGGTIIAADEPARSTHHVDLLEQDWVPQDVHGARRDSDDGADVMLRPFCDVLPGTYEVTDLHCQASALWYLNEGRANLDDSREEQCTIC